MSGYYELKIKINPGISEIVSNICFENFQCDGVVLAEEEYKDDLVLVTSTEGTLKAYIKNDGVISTLSPLAGEGWGDGSINDKCKIILEAQKQLLVERGLTEDDLGSWDFEIMPVESQDWSKKWKENWTVTEVSDRIKIVPSWIDYQPKNNEVTITLDPGTAFGTGTHATTQLCLRAIEKYMPQNAKIADVGTGSGILAICAAKLGADYAYGCDNDQLVIKTAQENAEMNNVSEICYFEHKTADEYTNEAPILESFRGKKADNNKARPDCPKFDLITANILHNILAEIMDDLKALMNDGAILILSGILDEKKQVVLDSIKKHGLQLIEEMQQDIWTALIVKKK